MKDLGTRRIIIDPVTRIEGHAKITIYLDEKDQVSDARFHVAEFRGFEKFCEGRPFWEMPALTARVCGICPVSHVMASSKTGDGLLAVQIPAAAVKLRRLMNLGQIVQSHALSFFHMSAPDLLMGMDSDPVKRNLFGLLAVEPDLVRGGIRLRQFGQEIIEFLGSKKVHPAWSVPGGVRSALTPESRAAIRSKIPEVLATARTALDRLKRVTDDFQMEIDSIGNFPSLFLSLVGKDGNWDHYDGDLRLIDSEGKILVSSMDPLRYREYIGEAVQSDSYLKSPYYIPLGVAEGMYRVGPLARLNICERMGTRLADRELIEYRERYGRIALSSFLFHHARLIEIIAGIELIEQLLDDPDIVSDHLRAEAGVNRRESVGVSEAPRGTLFHHYKVDETGLLTYVNLVIATGQNNLAMNRSMVQIAREFIKGPKIPEGVLNRLEAGIRTFDPCLSCSTHAVGEMPLHLQLVRASGEVCDEIRRS